MRPLIPRIPEDITADWLNANVGWRVPPGVPISSTVLSHSDEMGSVYKITAGEDSIVIKKSPTTETVIGELVSRSQLLWREVHLYDLLRRAGSPTSLIAPKCRWYRADARGRGAFALDEVLTAPMKVGAVMTGSLSDDDLSQLMTTLAVFHGCFAVRSESGAVRPEPWLFRHDTPQMLEWFALGFDDLHRMLEDRSDAQAILRQTEQISFAHVSTYSHNSVIETVCNGDLWPGNFLKRRSPMSGETAFAVIDWQFVTAGNPLTDVATVLMTTLSPIERQRREPSLLRKYHTEFMKHTSVSYSFEECWADYERAKPYAAMVMLCALDGWMTPLDASQKRQFQSNVTDALGIFTNAPALMNVRSTGLPVLAPAPATTV